MLSEVNRQKMIDFIQPELSEKRFEHVLRVEQTALQLAKHYSVDITSCQSAALLHDYAKEWSFERYQAMVEKYHLNVELLEYGSEILHGPVAAAVLKEQFPMLANSVFSAIEKHTIGACEMSLVDQVLFIADYIEPNRTFKGVEEARLLAQENLESAVKYKVLHSLEYLATQKKRIYPPSVTIYNAWLEKGE